MASDLAPIDPLRPRRPQPLGTRPGVRRAVVALMLREMSTRFGRSPGGYIWALVEPIGALVVMSIVFALLLRSPSLGNSFILFYASGYLPFTLYNSIQASVQGALVYSKPLLKYPAVSWIDAILARALLNFLTTVIVMAIVLFGILEFTDATAVLDFGHMVVAAFLAAILGFGVGTLNCLLVGLYPVYGQIWGIGSRPLFLAAGVIFIYEDMPPAVQEVLWYTPWIHITGIFRQGVYPTYRPQYIEPTLILIWALLPLALGLLLLRRHRQRILMR